MAQLWPLFCRLRGKDQILFCLCLFPPIRFSERNAMQEFLPIVPTPDPLTLFAAWFAEATAQEPADPNAMILANVLEKTGFPRAR
jgi:hypothetical protein